MWKIPLFNTCFDGKEVEAAQRVIRSGWLTMGEVTREFEGRFAALTRVKHAIAVSSCTAALHIAHRALGVGPGDEVICVSLSFVAAANAIVYTGARPVFAEIESLEDFGISPQDAEAKITPRTKAIQVMHYAGHPCDMDQIMAIARRFHLFVIEDCAHAPGAEYKGRRCGSIGEIGCFSFFSNKNMTTGEGGMVTTNDDEIAEKARLMRSHGMTNPTFDRHKGHASSYDVVELGYNYRMDEIRSAIGLVQLEKLRNYNQKRREIQAGYRERLGLIPGIRVPYPGSADGAAHHIFPVLLDGKISRDEFMSAMRKRGIQTSVHYPPIHLFEWYQRTFGSEKSDLPTTEEVAKREVTLPLYPSMKQGDIEYVCNTIAEFVRKAAP